MSLFAPHAFEFFRALLNRHEFAGGLVALGPGGLCHHFALELRAFTDRALRKIICCDARKKGAALRVVGLDLDRRRFKTGQIIQTSSREKLVSTLAASTLSREELPYRLRQQSLLGEFGR